MKFAIGTAQFGMNYGISNKGGQTKFKEVKEILEFSYSNGINTLDTAPSYGNSEEVLSKIIEQSADKNYHIISKTPKLNSDIDIKSQLDICFRQTKKLFGESFKTYLVHNANDFIESKELRYFLKNLKMTNQIEKIGVSIYNEKEITSIIEIGGIDVIQIPINVLDHRLIKSGTLKKMKQVGIEIHARSIFLQGLFFLEKAELSSKFPTSVDSINVLNKIAKKNSLEISELALFFVYNIPELDKIILGINDMQQLVSNVEVLSKEYDYNISENILETINFTDVNVLSPDLWNF